MTDVHFLFVGEVLVLGVLLIYRASHVIAAVADTLDFTDLTEHVTYLRLSLGTEMSFSHLIQIIRNLNLHIVGNLLVFFNSCE